MSDTQYIILIIGIGLVTYLPRLIPLLALSKNKLPGWATEWLDLIPVAVLGALLIPLLITSDEPKNIDFFRPELLVAIPVSLFALKTKSLSGTIIIGMLLFWAISQVM
jgi:branched-subunit amino acid transport protein